MKTGVKLRDIVNAISSTVDLVNDNVTRHHQRVAYIAYITAGTLGVNRERLYDTIIAAAMHDIGALSHDEEAGLLHNKIDEDVEEHAETGYMLLSMFKPLERVAQIIKYHHHQWDDGRGHVEGRSIVPFEGHIIHLADSVDMLINKESYILNQKDKIMQIVRSQSGNMFAPEVVEAFMKGFANDYHWLCLDHINLKSLLDEKFPDNIYDLNLSELMQFSKIISYIIDFRSPYTASHSSGVASVAFTLGRLCGYSDEDCAMLQIAGYLHDLGKIAIPPDVLEKEGAFSEYEFAVMRSHSYHTYRILKDIKGLEQVTEWAAHHHERLDGSGYPFGLCDSEISFGAKIVAAADVFSALTEERPYRKGMTLAKTRIVLEELSDKGKLSPEVVTVLLDNIQKIFFIREKSQQRALQEYLKINKNSTNRMNGLVYAEESE